MNVLQNKLVWIITGLAFVIVVLLAVIIGFLFSGNRTKISQGDFYQEIDKYDRNVEKALEHLETVRDDSDRIVALSQREIGQAEYDEVEKIARRLKTPKKKLYSLYCKFDDNSNMLYTVTVNSEILEEVKQKAISEAQQALLDKGLFIVDYKGTAFLDSSDSNEDAFLDYAEENLNATLDELGKLGKAGDSKVQKTYEELIKLIKKRVSNSKDESSEERWQALLDRVNLLSNTESVVGYPLDVNAIKASLVPLRNRFKESISKRALEYEEVTEAYDEYEEKLKSSIEEINKLYDQRSNKIEMRATRDELEKELIQLYDDYVKISDDLKDAIRRSLY